MLNGHKFVEVSDVVRAFGTPEGEGRALAGGSVYVGPGGGRAGGRPQPDLGIVFQNAVLLAWRSALDNVYFADKPIKGPKDLEGKKVSFTAGDSLPPALPAPRKGNSAEKP